NTNLTIYSFPTRRSSDLGRSGKQRSKLLMDTSSSGGGANQIRNGGARKCAEENKRRRLCSFSMCVPKDVTDSHRPDCSETRGVKDRKSTRLNSSHVKISY